MDRISQLPDFIIHHILSYFNTWDAELVRMSVLSKSWFNLTASLPFLDFYIDHFTYSRECFFKYVEYTTSRFCHHNVTAHSFKLVTTIEKPAELDIVNRCLELVLEKGVRELVISINYLSEYSPSSVIPKYRLPDILLSVSVLESLIICGCELPSSLMLDAVNFKSLIELTLLYVQIDDEAITHIITSCPLLEEFCIRYCHGFKRFCVYGHQNLQSVWIYYYTPVERIDIEAPNLSDLLVVDWNGTGAPQMNLASCKELTSVTYMGHPLPNSNGFTDLLSNFPFVENLILATSYKCTNLKLSSRSLRTLVLHSNHDLPDTEFNTPNLDLFLYSCNAWDPWHVITHSSLLQACMQSYPTDQIVDTVWFHELRLVLDEGSEFKVLNLYIRTMHSRKITELEKLKEVELPPYELKHVELHLDTHEESSDHAAFVDAVLWCCRPRSLTLRSASPIVDFEDVAKFTHEKLLQQEDQGHTSIQIVSPSSSEVQTHFKGLMSLPGALPREGKAVSFVKEEVLQEEAG